MHRVKPVETEESDGSRKWESLQINGHTVSWGLWLVNMKTNQEFREAFVRYMKTVPYDYFFECFPVSSSTLHVPFQCVFAKTKQFDGVEADTETFKQQLNGAKVVIFDNLDKTAKLIIPDKPVAHLAEFMRTADDLTLQWFWQQVAASLLSEIEKNPKKTFWLSTHGTNVAWVHVRIDQTPKYYKYTPFK